MKLPFLANVGAIVGYQFVFAVIDSTELAWFRTFLYIALSFLIGIILTVIFTARNHRPIDWMVMSINKWLPDNGTWSKTNCDYLPLNAYIRGSNDPQNVIFSSEVLGNRELRESNAYCFWMFLNSDDYLTKKSKRRRSNTCIVKKVCSDMYLLLVCTPPSQSAVHSVQFPHSPKSQPGRKFNVTTNETPNLYVCSNYENYQKELNTILYSERWSHSTD